MKKLGFGRYEGFGISQRLPRSARSVVTVVASESWCLRSSSFCVEKICK